MDLVKLFDALSYAAEKHRNQHRKGAESSPYINHPIEVARVLVKEGGVEDDVTLAAAILHDTVEDAGATRKAIEERFGTAVSDLVMELTDDKSLEKHMRKELQVRHAPRLSGPAKMIKIADKICNVRDILEKPPRDWSPARKREYLEWSKRVVEGCRGSNERLERCFDDLYGKGRGRLGISQEEG